MRTRVQIVQRALLHVGHREIQPNDSPLIRAWLRRCGVTTPAPWCAAFASWCVEERSNPGDYGEPVQLVAQAGVLKLAALFPETLEPQPGDLMWFPTDDKGHGHVGIVIAVGATQALCIEGNSENRVRCVRRLRSEVRFARTRDEDAGPALEILKPWAASFEFFPLVRVSYEGTR